MNQPNIRGFRTEGRTEQTRFHFHMDLCIGCHACEVACSEQNALPVDTAWRRVGEIEGGTFPDTERFFISSGCNHCLDAPCMKGCPVDAYQVNQLGAVIHLDDVCIGCQYCTWNCPYGVPVFQKDRHIVTKCDLCSHRLIQNKNPACVDACPAGAIKIETVPLQEVIDSYLEAGVGPDMPSPSISMPSTKITLPSNIQLSKFTKVNEPFVKPEDPHTPLIFMTVLTQLGLGGFLSIWLADLVHISFSPHAGHPAFGWLGLALMALIGISLNASTLHLGRPLYAHRAIKNWRTSWLSREVLALGLFSAVAGFYAFLLFNTYAYTVMDMSMLKSNHLRMILGLATFLSGVLGVYCSSMLYRVPARPVWDSFKTTFDFFMCAMILGPASFILSLGASALVIAEEYSWMKGYVSVAAIIAVIGILIKTGVHTAFTRRLSLDSEFEKKASAILYTKHFGQYRLLKGLLFTWAIISLFHVMNGLIEVGTMEYMVNSGLAFLALLCANLLDRYLFFVTVVPRNIPGNYVATAHNALTLDLSA